MLFDEPTSALDPQMSAEVLDVIVELARGGQTMVVVTHDHGFARRAATQVVELVAGRVHRAGPAAEIFAGAGGCSAKTPRGVTVGAVRSAAVRRQVRAWGPATRHLPRCHF